MEAISKNTGFSENRIQRIKDHVFNDTHIKDHGIGRFDPDFELSQAWERLMDGKYVDSDVQLLHHELLNRDLKAYSIRITEQHMIKL